MLMRKMLRDMKNNLVQFLSIFIMSILGVAVLTGIHAEWYGMKNEVERYYLENRLPDLWVIGNQFDQEDTAKAKGVSGVADVSRRLLIDVAVQLEAEPVLRLNVVEDNQLSIPLSLEGEAFDISKEGIWLDASFAKTQGLGVGDALTFEAMSMKYTLPIKGLILHPEYVYNVKDDSELLPNPEGFGFGFVSRTSLPDDRPLPYNQLLVKAKPGTDLSNVQAELESVFNGRYHAMLTRKNHPSAAMFQSEIEQNKAMGGVFPVIFFMIAALAMLTTMTRMTANQRSQIGVLKALGYSNRQILFHYVSYGLWLGLAGGLLGLVIGPLIIPPILFTMQKSIYLLPHWYAMLSPVDGLAVAMAVLCCGVFSYSACRKELKDVPAAALRPRPPKAARHTRWEKGALWHRLGFKTQWNIRDILRSKLRSIMAVVGVLGCMTLLLCALGLRDTISGISGLMYERLHVYQSKIYLNEDIKVEELDSIEKRIDGQWIQESGIELKSESGKKTGSLTVLEKGTGMVFEDSQGNPLSLPGEGIALSYKMAELLKVRVGEPVEWQIIGQNKWMKSTVEAIFRTPMGQGIAMTDKAFEKMGESLKPTARLSYTVIDGGESLPGAKSVRNKDELIKSFDTMLESIQMMVGILVLAAVVLGVVVLYNLGSLSMTERLRELATLKVLGFFSNEIRSLLQKQNLWLTVLGIIAGIPLGYGLIGLILSTMTDTMDMQTDVSWMTLLLCSLGTFILSVGVNFLLFRRVRKIDMVSSLKAVE